jgi:hypothetical protein
VNRLKILKARADLKSVAKGQVRSKDDFNHQSSYSCGPPLHTGAPPACGGKRCFRQLRLAERSLVGCIGKSYHSGCQYLSGILVAPSSENPEGAFEAGRELHFFRMNFQEGVKP